MLKLCFDEGQLEQYLEQYSNVTTVIHASYDEESESDSKSCYYVTVEPW
jgi:hypothetical protein|tara:strand:+ start:297 stop:443 length:147 start_codon:yes stop_codon:yes gene_type:complete